jgi:hypothetical protein
MASYKTTARRTKQSRHYSKRSWPQSYPPFTWVPQEIAQSVRFLKQSMVRGQHMHRKRSDLHGRGTFVEFGPSGGGWVGSSWPAHAY